MKATKQKEKNIYILSSLLLSKLKPFSKHPFKTYNEGKMLKLAESNKEQGLIIPILVRPIKDKKYSYEIVTGHNRVKATQFAGLRKIFCDVRNIDDDTATIIMIDSNLQQRESILPSEKAFAYKCKLEAIKSQGKRNDLTYCQLGKKLSAEKIANTDNESWRNIYRYINLTNLMPSLLDKVDERKLAFIPAVELSYLRKDEQEWLYNILNREEHFGVPLSIASKLKGISKSGILTYEKIDKIIIAKNQEPPKAVKISYKAVRDFFSSDTTPKEFEETIKEALKEYFQKHPQKETSKA